MWLSFEHTWIPFPQGFFSISFCYFLLFLYIVLCQNKINKVVPVENAFHHYLMTKRYALQLKKLKIDPVVLKEKLFKCHLCTVALCLSFTFLWHDMVWYSYAMVCYFYAMLCYEIIKNDMIWYAIIWYAMLCYLRYEIWVNVPSFTEEFHGFAFLISDLQV